MIDILKKKEENLIKSIDVFLVNNYLQTKCHLTKSKKNYSFAFYVYQRGKVDAVFQSKYSCFNTNQVKLIESGEYRVKVFVKKNDTNDIKTMMSSAIQKTIIIDF